MPVLTESLNTVLLARFEKGLRILPWRETHDPYAITVSEFMLQQTQVLRVVPKYEAWLERFPSWHSLAEAPLADVLTLWQGLGYNRRAQNLQKAAKEVVSRWGGVLPEQREALETLPGIGNYTAGAICAFAWNMPVALIETNVRRVYLHHYFPDQEGVDDKQLLPLIAADLASSPLTSREFYYTLMDYGSELPRVAGNANVRSRHYAKQSAFEGSRRQVRGAVIRRLTRGSATFEELANLIDRSPIVIGEILEQLVAEGLVLRVRDDYQLGS